MANKMYIKTTLPSLENYYWCKKVGFALIKNIECTIGGSRIDKHFGLLYDIWYELTRTKEQQNGLDKMIGNVPELNNYNYIKNKYNVDTPEYTLYIPLQFWFNRNVGLSLPLIALQYHEVRFNIEFEKLENLSCIFVNVEGIGFSPSYDPKLKNTSILTDYIYLDQEERRRMAQVGHEYLIEQVQINNTESIIGNKQKFLLDFNHPCKEVIWVTRNNMYNKENNFITDYFGSEEETLKIAGDVIITSMINVLTDEEDSSGLYTSDDGWYKILDYIDGSGTISANTSQLFVISESSDIICKLNITITNNSDSVVNINTIDKIYINNKLYNYDSKYLSDYIDEISFEIEIDHNGSAGIRLPNNLNYFNHKLKLEDVSIPHEKFIFPSNLPNFFRNNYFSINQHFNYGLDLAGNGNLVETAKLQLNGQDRFDKQDGSYFNYVQPSQHHTNTPSGGIYCYSFGLNPEQHQPSGTCNLSRIDTALLILTFKDTLRSRFKDSLMQNNDVINGGELFICAINYNVLRVMSGMCGVAYAN